MATCDYRPLQPIGPTLTIEQEEAGWAIIDRIEAAKAAGDKRAELGAYLDLVDWQMAAGLLTRREVRSLLSPCLLELIATVDRTEEGRRKLQQYRDGAMKALNGNDYGERADAALFILSVDAVQNPRRHETRRQRRQAARATIAMTAENMGPCLESGHWAVEDVTRTLFEAVERLDEAEGGDE